MSRFHYAPPLGRTVMLLTYLAVLAAAGTAAVLGGAWIVFEWHP